MARKDDRRNPLEGWNLQKKGPPTPLDLISQKKKGRNRDWERENKSYAYRGVPFELRQEVTDLADALAVKVDEVAQVFVEYGFQCHQKGSLTFSPRPNPRGRKMTLYWERDSKTSTTAAAKAAKKSKKAKVSVEEEIPLWEQFAYYRFPKEIHRQLKELAKQYSVPVGQVLAKFLAHGLAEYQAQKLKLSAIPKEIKMTLKKDIS